MEKPVKHVRAGYSVAIVLILTGVALVVFAEEYLKGAITLINIGSVLLFVTFLRARRHRKGLVKDERTIRIGSYGLSYSWFVSFIILNLLFWIDNL